jgi:hypothetical protein
MTTTSAFRGRPIGPATWAGLSLALFVAAAFGIFPVLAVVRLAVETTHHSEMALWSVVWGGLSVVGVLVAGKLAFGRWLRVRPSAMVVAAIGIGLSVGTHVTLQQWSVERFGLYDPDLIGWTAALFAVLVGLATAAFGMFVAPRGALGWPLACVLLGSTMVAFILLTNVAGVDDGIAPESVPLTVWLGASGLYSAIVTAASVIRTRHAAATPER